MLTTKTKRTAGAKIRKKRKAKGFTLAEFSEKCDVPRSCLAGYESGTHEPSLARACRMAKGLKIGIRAFSSLYGL